MHYTRDARLLVLSLVLVLPAACGLKGDLYLPPVEAPPAGEAPAQASEGAAGEEAPAAQPQGAPR